MFRGFQKKLLSATVMPRLETQSSVADVKEIQDEVQYCLDDIPRSSSSSIYGHQFPVGTGIREVNTKKYAFLKIVQEILGV